MTEPEAHKGEAETLPGGLALFRRLLAAIGRIELVLAIIALIVVVVLSTAQAFLRYSLGTSLWWAQEVAANTVMVSYFLGIAYVFKTRQEIFIEFLTGMVPMRLQMVLFLFEQVLALVFALTLLWLVYLFSPTLFNMRTPVLGLPAIVTPAPLILSTVSIGLTSIYYFAFGLRALGRPTSARFISEIEEQGLILRPWADEEIRALEPFA